MPENGKISSPDQLNNYIRVTSPGTWIVLAAILVLLAGVFFWLFTGQLEVSAHTQIFTNANSSYAFLSREQLRGIKPGLPARIVNSHASGTVTQISAKPSHFADIVELTGDNNTAYMGANLFMVSLDIPDAPQGVSQAVIVLDTVKPISFLLR